MNACPSCAGLGRVEHGFGPTVAASWVECSKCAFEGPLVTDLGGPMRSPACLEREAIAAWDALGEEETP